MRALARRYRHRSCPSHQLLQEAGDARFALVGPRAARRRARRRFPTRGDLAMPRPSLPSADDPDFLYLKVRHVPLLLAFVRVSTVVLLLSFDDDATAAPPRYRARPGRRFRFAPPRVEQASSGCGRPSRDGMAQRDATAVDVDASFLASEPSAGCCDGPLPRGLGFSKRSMSADSRLASERAARWRSPAPSGTTPAPAPPAPARRYARRGFQPRSLATSAATRSRRSARR